MRPAQQSQNAPRPAPLVEVRRGPIVESRHRGHVAAVDGEGRLVASLGEPETVTYLRSSAKPFQVVPVITSGAADRFGLTEAELALACGSHGGEDLHAGVVAGVLEKIGLGEEFLKCGVPVFGMDVRAMALMYARLVAPPEDFDGQTRGACARLVAAMTRHPELVGGTRERFDTEVMRAGRGLVVSKIGAEGVYTAGVPACERWPKGLGLAFKIEDGEDRRSRSTIAIESLRQLGVLDEDAQKSLSPYASFPVLNHRGEIVGQIQASFRLEGL